MAKAKGNSIGNIVLLLLLAAVAATGAIVLIRRTREEATQQGDGDTTPQPWPGNVGGGSSNGGASSGGTSGGSATLNMNLVLKNGIGFINNNAEVKALQLILNKVEVANPLVVDGMFGPKTETKLKRLNGGFGQISLAQAKVKWPWA